MKMKDRQIIKYLIAILFLAVLVYPNDTYGRAWMDTKGDLTLTNSPDSVVVVPAGSGPTSEKHSTIYHGNLTINAGVTLQLSQYSVFHFCDGYHITVNGYITIPVHDNRRIVKQCLATNCRAGAYVDDQGRCWRAAPAPTFSNNVPVVPGNCIAKDGTYFCNDCTQHGLGLSLIHI